MKSRRLKVPASVLERAKVAAEQTSAKKPPAPSAPRAVVTTRRSLTRAKVVAALKKLHPMD